MIHIREQDPLKQGLKHHMTYVAIRLLACIREQDPLKQGLKLYVQIRRYHVYLIFASKIH